MGGLPQVCPGSATTKPCLHALRLICRKSGGTIEVAYDTQKEITYVTVSENDGAHFPSSFTDLD